MNRLPLVILAQLLTSLLFSSLLLSAAFLTGCGGTDSADHQHDSDHEEESWAVTTWGDRFEIFAEAGMLEAGALSTSHTHVTLLSDFSPVEEGVVSAILREAASGSEDSQQTFRQDSALRAGIFSIEITPEREGIFDLFFMVETASGNEEIAAGQVRVGPPGDPGGPLATTEAEASSEAAISFLKEQQWRTEFATAWTQEGSLSSSVQGPGRVRPVAGGEDLLTAAVDGSVLRTPWPFPGLHRNRNDTVFRLTPVVASGRSLAELQAATRGLEAELTAVRARAARLAELLTLGAVSVREAEENNALLLTLEAQLEAARGDLESARALRQQTGESAETISISAPFRGQISEVMVTPGQAVGAGTALARLVKTEPVWIEVALRPEAASKVVEPIGLNLRTPGAQEPLSFAADKVRLISTSPEVDVATGAVEVLLEVESSVEQLRLGSAVEAEILLDGRHNGIVVPSQAIVDDGGIDIVYLQPSGEEFLRREVRVVARQGTVVLVEGVSAGERLVTRGGNSIRRATLVAAGPGEGHVH